MPKLKNQVVTKFTNSNCGPAELMLLTFVWDLQHGQRSAKFMCYYKDGLAGKMSANKPGTYGQGHYGHDVYGPSLDGKMSSGHQKVTTEMILSPTMKGTKDMDRVDHLYFL